MDIVDRAEAAMKTVVMTDNDIIGATKLIPELVAELKAARAEAEKWEKAFKALAAPQ